MTQDKNKRHENPNAVIWAAVITGIVTIIVTILGFPPLVAKLDAVLNPTPTNSATPASTETPSLSHIVSPTETPGQTIATPPANTPTDTVIPTQPQGNGTMIAQITTNAYEGRAPLRVTFRADSSHVTFPDGSVEACKYEHVCSYTWDVREQNGPIIHGPVTGGSEFSYEFSKRGVFMVVVYVCRGQACGFTSVTVTTK